jgi:hypothetical protein
VLSSAPCIASSSAPAEPPDTAHWHGLRVQERVPRELVHRASMDEVFLVGGVQLEPDRMLLAAQWPADHALFHRDAHGRSDPLLLVETARQAAIFIAHRFCGVPLTRRFIFCGLSLHLDDDRPEHPVGSPLDVELDVRLRTEGEPTPRRFGARLDVGFQVAGRRCGRISVRFLAVGEALYTAIRRPPAAAHTPPLPSSLRADLLPADLVGRRNPHDVLLTHCPERGTGTYRMHVDPQHRGYFEHACDHVPGVALAEAFRQAGHHALHHAPAPGGRRPSHGLCFTAVSFDRFCELDAPVEITVDGPDAVHQGGQCLMRLTAVQNDRVVARSRTAYRPTGRR